MALLAFLSFIVLAAAFAFAGWRARVQAPVAFALAAGCIVAWAAVLMMRDSVVRASAPMPLGAEAWVLLGVAAAAAALTLLVWALPTRAARLMVALAALAFAALLLGLLIPVSKLQVQAVVLILASLALGIVLPRVIALAAAGRSPRAWGVGAGAVLIVALLIAAGVLFLGMIFGGQSTGYAEWSVTVQPNATGHYELQVPYLATNDSRARAVLEGVRANIAARGPNATLRPMPTGDGFILSADGPTTIGGSYRFIGGARPLFETGVVHLTSVAWRHDGPGAAFASWTFGKGCGDQAGGSLWVDESGRTDPPQPPPFTANVPPTPAPPSAPTSSPCYHGD